MVKMVRYGIAAHRSRAEEAQVYLPGVATTPTTSGSTAPSTAPASGAGGFATAAS